jgi:hypothetical protein
VKGSAVKKTARLLPLLALSLLLTGCAGFVDHVNGGRTVKTSAAVVSQTREASGFTAVDMRGAGKVILTQGETESLTVSGSDNLVPLVMTSVQNGVLVIEMKEKVVIIEPNPANVLTIAIGVRDLTALTVSGLGDVEMDGLSASRLEITMSGAGRIDLKGLDLEDLRVTLSGAGDVILSGGASSAVINLPGAGKVDAGGLKLQNAQVTIAGLGNATVWVTGTLTGTISGAGSVEYYGEPETEIKTSGLGKFKSLGSK